MSKRKQVTVLEPDHEIPYEGEITDQKIKDDAAGFDFKLLYHPLSKYSVDTKIKAVMLYMMTGDAKKSAKQIGVPHTTLLHWKNHSCWWEDTLKKARLLKQDELDASLTKVIESGAKALQDRIDYGNPTKIGQTKEVNPKTGKEEVTYKFDNAPIPAKELATVLGIVYDKRALSRGEATSRVDGPGGDGIAALGQLIQSFQKIGEDAKRKRRLEAVEADFTVVSEEALDKIKAT